MVESRITTIAGYGSAIAKALEHCGVDSRRVFKAAGVPGPLENDPLRRLDTETLTRLYRICVEVTGDAYFGLTVAKFIHASNLHALGHSLLASSTLWDFCQRVQRYFRLVSQTARIEVAEKGGDTYFAMSLLAEVCGESQDAWFGFVIRTMRLLCRADFKPLRVEFPHPVPAAGDAPYLRYFGCPVLFGRPAGLLVLPGGDMRNPLQGACPELAQFNDNIAARYLAKLDRSDVIARVRAEIIERLPSGACGRETVAAALAMSPATLQLKLGQRGTGFNELLNEIRHELACSYLKQPGMPITEIAFLLGFTEISNFTRAFKRWAGMSPSAYRNQA